MTFSKPSQARFLPLRQVWAMRGKLIPTQKLKVLGPVLKPSQVQIKFYFWPVDEAGRKGGKRVNPKPRREGDSVIFKSIKGLSST